MKSEKQIPKVQILITIKPLQNKIEPCKFTTQKIKKLKIT
jgi:hypothetical protein